MTGYEIFDRALAIMDEVGEGDDYEPRTLDIINALGHELYPYSDTVVYPTKPDGSRNYGKRPIFTEIESLDDAPDLDDYICGVVLPYGLVAHLLMDENPGVASTCLQRYNELFSTLAKNMNVGFEDIVDYYEGDRYNSYFTRWGGKY